MGLGNSRDWFGNQQENQSVLSGYGYQPPKKRRRCCFRRRRSIATTPLNLPVATQPVSGYTPSYYSQATRPMPIYSLVQPTPAPMLPINYNNYPNSPYVAPPFMMMPPQRFAPPISSPYMPIPYPQQTLIQPAYNNIGVPGANSPYSAVPPRLITDWTGGGVISPGFLGPPI